MVNVTSAAAIIIIGSLCLSHRTTLVFETIEQELCPCLRMRGTESFSSEGGNWHRFEKQLGAPTEAAL